MYEVICSMKVAKSVDLKVVRFYGSRGQVPLNLLLPWEWGQLYGSEVVTFMEIHRSPKQVVVLPPTTSSQWT